MSNDAPEPLDLDRIISEIRRLPEAERADGIRERCGGDFGLELRVRTALESDEPETIDGLQGDTSEATVGDEMILEEMILEEMPEEQPDAVPGTADFDPDQTIELEVPKAAEDPRLAATIDMDGRAAPGASDGQFDATIDLDDTASGKESTGSESDSGRRTEASGGRAAFTRMPERIADFKVLKLLGSGGMGSVYLGRQEHPDREAAVKVMKLGLATPAALQRFEFEVETLARLNHPGIAELYEAGIYENETGEVPYVAMEYVTGARPITNYARDVGLDLRGRLELFRSACDAVAFGHARGVIHRDLKPPNILADDDGNPKVIDFGVARAVEGGQDESRKEIVGTLQYMSPEQIAGSENIDTSTDVYALGLILYELLSGQQAYEVRATTLAEATTVISEIEVPDLSTVAIECKGDLETICAKAIEKDPARRYRSASDLGDDIQRFLDDEPVTARPPSTWETLQRLARKHKPVVAMIATTLLVIVVSLVAVSVFAVKAENARVAAVDAEGKTRKALREVERQQERTENSLQFFLYTIGEMEPVDMGDFMVDRMVDRMDTSMERAGIEDDAIVDAIEAMRSSAEWFNPSDVATDLLIAHIVGPTQEALPAIADDPKTMAYLQEFVGQTFGNLGRLGDAEKAYAVAIELWRSLETADGGNRRRAEANYAEVLIQLARVDEAIVLLTTLVEVGRKLDGTLDESALMAQNSLATALVSEARYDEASRSFKEALEGFRARAAEGFTDAAARAETIEMNLGAVLVLQGELEEARPLLESAVEAMRSNPESAENLDQVLVNLGRLEFASGDFPAALQAFEEATTIARRRFGREHVRSAAAGHELGQLNFQLVRYAEAIPILEEVVATRRRLLGPTAASTLQTGLYLPLAHLKTGDLDAAIATRDRFDSDFIAAGDEIGPNRLQMLYFFMQFANELGTVAGEREATIALERLHDSCVSAPSEISGGPICSDVMRFLPLFYDAMMESEPEGDWASRRAERFGS